MSEAETMNDHFGLAVARLNEGRLDESEAICRSLIQRSPRTAMLWNFLGVVLVRKRDPVRGIEALARAVDLDPTVADFRDDLGTACATNGDSKRAREHLARAIALDPGRTGARRKLCGALLELGDDAAALEQYGAIRAPGTAGAPRVVRSARFRPEADFGREPYVVAIEDCLVVADRWLVLRGENLFHEELLNRNIRLAACVKEVAQSGRMLIDLPEPSHRLEADCALLGGSDNYFHWLVDYLCRLPLLDGTPGARGLPLVVNSPLAPFQRDALAMAGVDAARLIEVRSDSVVACRRILVPTLMGRGTRLHPMAINWLRSTYRRPSPRGGGRKVYISRQNAPRRRVLNEAELASHLAARGFETVAPDALSFAEQLDAVAGASVIVGPHGAGLANMIFAADGVTVVEIANKHALFGYTTALAASFGARLKTVIGTIAPGAAASGQAADFTIDMAAALATIDAAVAEAHARPRTAPAKVSRFGRQQAGRPSCGPRDT
jgi:capsular polysaccharide biosynthesis protein